MWVKVSRKGDLHCAERPSLNIIYKCRGTIKDQHNIIKLQGDTAKMLFGAMLEKAENPDLAGILLTEGAVSCQRTLDDIPSYQCSIQL